MELAAAWAELTSSEGARADLATELKARAAALAKLEAEASVLRTEAEVHKVELAASKGMQEGLSCIAMLFECCLGEVALSRPTVPTNYSWTAMLDTLSWEHVRGMDSLLARSVHCLCRQSCSG